MNAASSREAPLCLAAVVARMGPEVWTHAGLGLSDREARACAPALVASARMRARLAVRLEAEGLAVCTLDAPLPSLVRPLLTEDAATADRHLLLICAADAADAIRSAIAGPERVAVHDILGRAVCRRAIQSVPPGHGRGPLPSSRTDARERGLALVRRLLETVGEGAAEWLALRFGALPEAARNASALRWIEEAVDAPD